MATIKKLDNGKWFARIFLNDINDLDSNGKPKRKQKAKQGFRTKREAEKWARDTKVKFENGEIVAKDVIPSFVDYFNQWAKTYRYPEISEVTKRRYKEVAKHLKKNFGNRPINKITRMQYQIFLNKFSAKYAPSTVSKTRGLIKSALDSAVADKLIPVNFALGTTAKGNKDKKRTVTYPTIEQIKGIQNLAYSTRNPNYPSKYMIITAILTGMRVGEVGGLTWDCINFESRTISIEKAYRYVKYADIYKNDERFKPLKNEYSKRKIKVNLFLLDTLKELKNNNSELVFASPFNGKIPSPTGAGKVLHKLVTDLGYNLENFHFHSLRDCHVALLHHLGIDWYAISQRLGHKDLTMTLKEYAYLADEDKRESDEAIKDQLEDFSTEKVQLNCNYLKIV